MRKYFTLFALSLILVVAGKSQSLPGVQTEDADLPGFLNGRVDKQEYLKLRDEQTDAKRGLPYFRAGIEREKALREMNRQQLSKASSVSSVVWSQIGPAPIPNGQTNTVSMAVSGRVTCIAIDPTSASIVYVGTAQGGVYRTLDGGTSWTAIFDNAQSLAIGAIAIAPSDPTTVYVGTGEANLSGDSFFGVGLYRIDDARGAATLNGPINPSITTGTTTTITTNCFTGRTISKILVHPTDPATIFVATASGISGVAGTSIANTAPPLGLRGIYRSTNATSAAGTITFTKLTVMVAGGLDVPSTGNRSVMDMVFDPSDPNVLIASVLGVNSVSGEGGFYRSTNALSLTPSFTQTLTLALNIRGAFSINKIAGTVTVLGATGESSGTLRRSTDGGATWSAAISGVTGFCGGQCFYDIIATIDQTDASIIYVGGSANSGNAVILKKSTNAGAAWTTPSIGLHSDVHAIEIAATDHNTIYTGSDGGVWKSTDAGANWTSLNNSGFSATQYQSLAVHPIDPKFTIGGAQDNGSSMLKPDNTWTRIDFGDGGFSLIDQGATNTTNVTMYHTYFNQANNLIGVARVTNVGCATEGQWLFRGAGFTDATIGCEGSALAASNGIGVSNTVLFYAPIALGPGTPNTLYFGTDRLYRSINRGDAMSVVSQAPLVSGSAISAIGISPQNDNVRIIGLNTGKVYATNSGSSTLTDITSGSFPVNPNGSTSKFVSRAVIDPNTPSVAYVTFSFYAPAGQGIWRTTDITSSAGWAARSNGIPSVPINAFVVDPQNSNNLFAGTDIGVYVSTDAGLNWVPYSSGLPRVAVFDMAITSARTLRIATHGRGMWESAEQPLPIEMTTFSARLEAASDVVLEWSTMTETNNYGFYVQRRDEKSSGFSTVSGLIAGAGTSLDPHDYSWTDHNAKPGVYFYRLRQVDLDNNQVYSSENVVTISGVTSVEATSGPTKFSLEQNYPNPFNPVTDISFSVEKTEHAVVKVFSVDGQEVAELYNEMAESGRFYHVKFDASQLGSGTYYYRVTTDSRTASKKMLLLK